MFQVPVLFCLIPGDAEEDAPKRAVPGTDRSLHREGHGVARVAAGLELDLDSSAGRLGQLDVDLIEAGVLRGPAGVQNSRRSAGDCHGRLNDCPIEIAAAFR